MSEYDPIPPGPDSQYIAYPKAMKQLAERFKASPEELAIWVRAGPGRGLGGLTAYCNANELDPPPEFYFDPYSGDDPDCRDYLSPLMRCWFRKQDILNFSPTRRFITGAALIERWSGHPGIQPEAFILAKIEEDRLLDTHPISGLTQGSLSGDEWYPPMSSGLFELSKIEAIEKEDLDFTESDTSETTVDDQTGSDLAPDANLRETTDPCAVFREMENLAADEVTIAFVGDRNEDGLGANNMLEISARDVKRKRVPLATLDLIDKRTGKLNRQGLILLGLAKIQMLPRGSENTQRMSRLRSSLCRCVGLHGDPFEDCKLRGGWQPRFQIVDRRGAADERAKREGERHTEPFDQVTARGSQLADTNDAMGSSDHEEDDADAWLREYDLGSDDST